MEKKSFEYFGSTLMTFHGHSFNLVVGPHMCTCAPWSCVLQSCMSMSICGRSKPLIDVSSMSNTWPKSSRLSPPPFIMHKINLRGRAWFKSNSYVHWISTIISWVSYTYTSIHTHIIIIFMQNAPGRGWACSQHWKVGRKLHTVSIIISKQRAYMTRRAWKGGEIKWDNTRQQTYTNLSRMWRVTSSVAIHILISTYTKHTTEGCNCVVWR